VRRVVSSTLLPKVTVLFERLARRVFVLDLTRALMIRIQRRSKVLKRHSNTTSLIMKTVVFNAINGIYDRDNFVSVTRDRGLLDFSEDAYNITGFYEKYGLSARLRYTWRDAFRTLDTAQRTAKWRHQL